MNKLENRTYNVPTITLDLAPIIRENHARITAAFDATAVRAALAESRKTIARLSQMADPILREETRQALSKFELNPTAENQAAYFQSASLSEANNAPALRKLRHALEQSACKAEQTAWDAWRSAAGVLATILREELVALAESDSSIARR